VNEDGRRKRGKREKRGKEVVGRIGSKSTVRLQEEREEESRRSGIRDRRRREGKEG
jgi:hypothetical protein